MPHRVVSSHHLVWRNVRPSQGTAGEGVGVCDPGVVERRAGHEQAPGCDDLEVVAEVTHEREKEVLSDDTSILSKRTHNSAQSSSAMATTLSRTSTSPA